MPARLVPHQLLCSLWKLPSGVPHLKFFQIGTMSFFVLPRNSFFGFAAGFEHYTPWWHIFRGQREQKRQTLCLFCVWIFTVLFPVKRCPSVLHCEQCFVVAGLRSLHWHKCFRCERKFLTAGIFEVTKFHNSACFGLYDVWRNVSAILTVTRQKIQCRKNKTRSDCGNFFSTHQGAGWHFFRPVRSPKFWRPNCHQVLGRFVDCFLKLRVRGSEISGQNFRSRLKLVSMKRSQPCHRKTLLVWSGNSFF